jgi:hypothetical protein
VALFVDGSKTDRVCVASEIKGLPACSQAVVELCTAISALQNNISPLIGSQIMSAFLLLFEQFGGKWFALLW